jgi:hypothetical protein
VSAVDTFTATPTASTLYFDGKQINMDGYTINGNNYFKLRDLAYMLNGTSKQFEIGWDGQNDAISLTSGKSYTTVGGEMVGKGAGSKNAIPTNSTIYLNGSKISLTAYTIQGNNYFKLRDVGQTFNFGVDWDGINNAISVNTNVGYTPENQQQNNPPPTATPPTPPSTTSTNQNNNSMSKAELEAVETINKVIVTELEAIYKILNEKDNVSATRSVMKILSEKAAAITEIIKNGSTLGIGLIYDNTAFYINGSSLFREYVSSYSDYSSKLTNIGKALISNQNNPVLNTQITMGIQNWNIAMGFYNLYLKTANSPTVSEKVDENNPVTTSPTTQPIFETKKFDINDVIGIWSLGGGDFSHAEYVDIKPDGTMSMMRIYEDKYGGSKIYNGTYTYETHETIDKVLYRTYITILFTANEQIDKNGTSKFSNTDNNIPFRFDFTTVYYPDNYAGSDRNGIIYYNHNGEDLEKISAFPAPNWEINTNKPSTTPDTTSTIKYYTGTAVPDFGEFAGIQCSDYNSTGDSTTYHYSVSPPFNSDLPIQYDELLLKNGFKYIGSFTSSTGFTVLNYNKGTEYVSRCSRYRFFSYDNHFPVKNSNQRQ